MYFWKSFIGFWESVSARFALLLVVAIAAWQMPTRVEAAITIQFDYTYDTNGFFAEGTEARNTLEWVGKFYSALLDDDLLAIDSSDENRYDILFLQPNASDHPATSEDERIVTIQDFDVPADTLIVFVGSKAMSGNTLSWSKFGGVSVEGTASFVDSAISRGEGSGDLDAVYGATAYESGIWGGSVSINTNYNWNEQVGTLPTYDEFDLADTLLLHLSYVLGFADISSWDNLVIDDTFTGPASVAANGGIAPTLSDNGIHWGESVPASTIFGTGDSQTAMMKRLHANTGIRVWATELDVAALDDIGWDINPVDTWTGASGGTFSTASNWSTGVSPDWRDSIRFDFTGSQTVSFNQDQQILQASFESGQATWALNGHTVQADLLWLTGHGTLLCVEGGTLQVGVMATLGSSCGVSVGSAGRLELLGATLDGTLLVDLDGELCGDGVITKMLMNRGVFSPGGSGEVGSFDLKDYYQFDTAVLEMDVLGLNDNDSFTVENGVTLAGDLVVNLDPACTLNLGDRFTLFSYNGDLTGEFDSISGNRFSNGLELTVIYDTLTRTVSLIAVPGNPVPEPSALVMLALALVAGLVPARFRTWPRQASVL